MKYLNDGTMRDIDSADDLEEPTAALEERLTHIHGQLLGLKPGFNPLERAQLLVEKGRLLVRLERMTEAWDAGREAFDVFLAADAWQEAVEACDLMFATEEPQALIALGHGVWLAVTFPVDPELTVAMLNHIVDETPASADGAAVAAVTAHYVVELRAQGRARDDLLFFTNNLLGEVARRHSGVESQDAFTYWMEKLELNDPAKFLVRLRNVVDVLVQEDWWFDRDALRDRLPVN